MREEKQNYFSYFQVRKTYTLYAFYFNEIKNRHVMLPQHFLKSSSVLEARWMVEKTGALEPKNLDFSKNVVTVWL